MFLDMAKAIQNWLLLSKFKGCYMESYGSSTQLTRRSRLLQLLLLQIAAELDELAGGPEPQAPQAPPPSKNGRLDALAQKLQVGLEHLGFKSQPGSSRLRQAEKRTPCFLPTSICSWQLLLELGARCAGWLGRCDGNSDLLMRTLPEVEPACRS